ncbi:MAG: glycine--tRNA ligase [Candidatus Marinimicrobia bacterium]|jgi:glycyl-tRNA synthetase|nr:glycine--tRNA ligase [Candidatus Neomarinimicrobiota bacterium]MBT3629704.1 glycine--tRNA ligase [Candidatus Neomarinimicrobiota bacterium]MBT3824866.1 glycine--tRNA ligase [Candidatus Neomarinimicrobiota bacterium]MBT4131317.1 glycine--tRNA ligase [Candidatus Neomarinimicrobiota bacterium]MBT4294297.1 glycine--tRNA ligase [Candidatus Neomarinimicrobiota bacterium]
MARLESFDKLVSLSKRRGFIFQSSEIYGGINACYDYGPLGVELKRNVKQMWWNAMTRQHDNIVGLDAAILMHPKVWEASGHVGGFTDPLVDCKKCKTRFREDTLPEANMKSKECPECGGELTESRQFNLMFKTQMGAVEDTASTIYLRPETAQGIFVNFPNVVDTSRQQIPFGIAQIGKAFRNEITPGNFIFRTREFEQMEMQFFVNPEEADEWFETWKERRMAFYDTIGIDRENLRFHEHGPDELAHYARAAFDVEYKFPIGWSELEGIHNRADFDLKQHEEFSGKNMGYRDPQTNKVYTPFIIETSAGCDRTTLAAMCEAYEEETLEDGSVRTVMHFHPRLAPIKVAILPLVKKGGLKELATEIKDQLKSHFNVFYDEKGAIGRRYRRMDEAGTPYCVTIDFDTLDDKAVTVRDRDSMDQIRVPIAELQAWLAERILIS